MPCIDTGHKKLNVISEKELCAKDAKIKPICFDGLSTIYWQMPMSQILLELLFVP